MAPTRFAILLFSDVVGSTESKSRHGVPAFSEALNIHNALFERLARECRGLRIVQNTGDGYFAEADSIAEAVKFALLFQDAMRDEPWGEVRLASRVGVHAGEITSIAAENGNGIVAPAADMANRVMSLALGGQILLTRVPFDEARHFIREHPPVAGKAMPGLQWLHHGAYLLKGADRPVDIFEVGAEGLAPLAPPPDAEKATRTTQLDTPSQKAARASHPRPVAPVRRFVGHFISGILAMSFFLLLKLGFESLPWGRSFEGWLNSQLHLAPGPDDPSRANDIVLVDITGIEAEAVDEPPLSGETKPPEVTSRAKLAEIVGAIAEMKPKVIAIDIDFSAFDDGRPVTRIDSAFFEQILGLSRKHRVPIYLGVSRQCWKDAAQWLGEERFASLAAGIEVPAEPRFYMRWQRGADVPRALPSFALALAGRTEDAGFIDRGTKWSWAVRSEQMREGASGEMSWAFVDYDPIRTLENQHLSVINLSTLLDNKLKFRDRMVLIGDVVKPQYHDRFNIGEFPNPLPGIYLHASAALTATGAPILEWTPKGRLVLNATVVLVLAGLLAGAGLICQSGRLESRSRNRWPIYAAAGVGIVASSLLALLLTSLARVVWTDFTGIVFGLLVGLYFLNRIDDSRGRFGRWLSGQAVYAESPTQTPFLRQ